MACFYDDVFSVFVFGMGHFVRRETAACLENAGGGSAKDTVVIRLDGLRPQFLGALCLFHGLDTGGVFIKLTLGRIWHLHQ